jgi:hypothetical protein
MILIVIASSRGARMIVSVVVIALVLVLLLRIATLVDNTGMRYDTFGMAE